MASWPKPPLDSPIPPKKAKIDEGTRTKSAPITPNWLDLPQDVTAMILHKVGAMEIMNTVEHVCSAWRNICMDPLMWRTIHMKPAKYYNFEITCRRAIDRCSGHLEEIHLEEFATDRLLDYVANRTSHLRCLRLEKCTTISDKAFIEVIEKLPLLEELDISLCYLSSKCLEAVGRFCNRLTSLKLNNKVYNTRLCNDNSDALAIAKNMPKLKHLQIMGNNLSNSGLFAILDGCPLLESLDLRGCNSICLRQDRLREICLEKIKEVHFPIERISEKMINIASPYDNEEYFGYYCICLCDCGYGCDCDCGGILA